MSSEWLKVMLDEIARKKVEAEQGAVELERRRAEDAAARSSPARGPLPNPASRPR